MPELPEVETVRAGLGPAVSGALVTAIDVVEPRSLRRHAAGERDFVASLTGRTITAAVRRGKFLWFPLESVTAHPTLALTAHLGMSGQLLLRSSGAPDDRQLRIRLYLEHPEHGEITVNFVDQRIFGSMAVDSLVATADALPGGRGSPLAAIPAQVAHIARDPLDPAFSDAGFLAALARKKTGIKRALLDQSLISGIGNIYADEALWAARIHYEQRAATLSTRRATTLLAEMRLVLTKALAEGGTSFDAQYVNVDGVGGYFAHSLNAYDRQGLPCPRCGRMIVREPFMNRSSHYCPYCQRLR